MKALINKSLINNLRTTDKQYDVCDTKLPGFMIRVTAKGKMNYVCRYARGRRVNIGPVALLTPAQAREKAKEILGDAVKGVYPNSEFKAKNITLKAFIDNEYEAWSKTHHKIGSGGALRIRRCFFDWLGDRPMHAILPLEIEKWRSSRLESGRKPGTINRDIGRLKAALSKAVEWGFLEVNPIASIKPLKEDIKGNIRYLSVEEEKRLRFALDKREENLRKKRDTANQWRKARGYQLLTDLRTVAFADYIKPMVLLSLNTGLRQGELFSLLWSQINFKERLLTIEGSRAKSGKTRHVPLNSEVMTILEKWCKQRYRPEIALVFPSKETGKQVNNVRKAWLALLKSASIEQFRWHDMRHHFASKLVMAGVDLNTVRELLGHSSIEMTLRYAHLAPEHKARAVEKLIAVDA